MSSFCPSRTTNSDSAKRRSWKSGKYVTYRSLQGSEPYAETGTQTFFKRKINKCLQIGESIDSEVKIKDDDLVHFLDNVYPEMEGALQSNETIDIFQNDFDVLPEDQSGNKESTELSNVIKETKNLFYLKSKGKKVSCIQFQPWLTGRRNPPIIAESFIENLSYDERIVFSMKSSKSFILFWNYEDLHAIDPLLILTSPLEVLTFEFNPKDPNIVIAGTINGQIMMWDLKVLGLGESIKKKGKKSDKHEIREIAPSLMSALQDPTNITPITDQIKRNVPSHKSPVVCIKWLPSGL
jgi:WD40 repeat protein